MTTVLPAPRSGASTDPVDEHLARVEARLLAEVAGDPAAATAVRSHLAAARARFADATVRQFLPILVERDVRRRVREAAGR
ncbi:three-helix bundle dimerization domain-containing protein [Blastococcus sp. SYSU D01042]